MSPRDPEATKARIFRAATAEFAAYGVAGARIDRIAEAAQANKQLIYAYFGDKQQLFSVVLERAMYDVADAVTTDVTDLDKWTDQHIDYHRAHPELLRLLMWEALETDPGHAAASSARAAKYAAKNGKVADAQDAGIARGDVPAPYLMLFLMSLVNYPEAVPQLRRLVLGEQHDPEELRRWTREAVRRVVAIDPGRAAEPDGEPHPER